MPQPPILPSLFPREPATSSTASSSSSSISLPSLLSILLPLLMLLLAIITLGVYKYVGWRRGKKLDEAVEKHAREVEQRRKLAKIRYVYGTPGMYGSGCDADGRMDGPPVGWCTQKWLEAADARRSFISLSSLSGKFNFPFPFGLIFEPRLTLLIHVCLKQHLRRVPLLWLTLETKSPLNQRVRSKGRDQTRNAIRNCINNFKAIVQDFIPREALHRTMPSRRALMKSP